jgi:hypothetical protein
MRPHPEAILVAQKGHDDPDQKIVAMLDARRQCLPAAVQRGSHMAAAEREREETTVISSR